MYNSVVTAVTVGAEEIKKQSIEALNIKGCAGDTADAIAGTAQKFGQEDDITVLRCDYEFNSLSFLPTAPGPKLI